MIYLIRHGQTELNREGRVQGASGDAPLTPLGEAQAKAVGKALAAIMAREGGDWRITCSPMGRTRRTSAIIADAMGLSPPAEADARLIEINYGALEGMLREEIDARWPHLAGVRGIFIDAPEGEPLTVAQARAAAWLADAHAGGGHVVAVAHAGIGRVIRALYAGQGEAELRLMDTPQDAFHRLHEGRVARIDCAPLALPG
ncbi:MAG TPA: histidine phosphatase family protein [Caulobacteraceae bacterium]|jgi:probable phosphoglycerate mutase